MTTTTTRARRAARARLRRQRAALHEWHAGAVAWDHMQFQARRRLMVARARLNGARRAAYRARQRRR